MTIYRRLKDMSRASLHGHAFLDDSGHVRSLDDIMEIDHIVRVHPDGWITDDGPWADRSAPELWEGKLDDAAWSLVGTSGQEGGGSVMHNSEFVGGRLADLMLAAPGLYVAVACYWECADDCDDECAESHMEGWGLAHLPDGEVTS